ncbi:hypothetical protein Tco_0245169 [Tanacetum coccineum]
MLRKAKVDFKRKGLKRQKEAKTIKNRQGTKETRTRVKNQPKIKAGSARHSKKGRHNEVPRTKVDKSSKFQGFIWSFKDSRTKVAKEEKCFIKEEKEEENHKD